MTTRSGFSSAAIRRADAKLEKEFTVIANFLNDFEEFRPARISRASYGTKQYFEDLAISFVRGRQPIAPEPPATIPDPLVSVIMNKYFLLPRADLERAKNEHKLAMASEGIVGAGQRRSLIPNEWAGCQHAHLRETAFSLTRNSGEFPTKQ